MYTNWGGGEEVFIMTKKSPCDKTPSSSTKESQLPEYTV